MLFSTSPVKSISEKIKPLSESGKGKVSRLKFDRKNDYKTFLNFIKKNTKDLEEQQVKKEKKTSTGAFGIIGLGLLGGLFGGGKKDDNAFKTSFIPKALQRAKLDAESQAKKKGKGTPFAAESQIFKKIKVNKRPFIPKRDPQPYSKKNLKKELIYNRERRDKIVKSKQSVVSEETVSNKNRVKKKLVNTRVAAEVGGQGFGGAGGNRRTINVSKTFPEDSSVGNRPPSSLGKGETPKDIQRSIKLTEDYEAGKITRQQYENELNKIKKFKPTDKTPKTPDQIAKDLGIQDKKTLRFNYKKGYQTNLFDPSVPFGNITGSGDSVVTSGVNPFRFDPREPFMDDDGGNSFRNQDRKFKQGSLFDKPKTKKIIDRSKFFTAPEVPKGQPKLSGFDKFNRFTDRVFNSPAYKFGSFIGGMMANYKLEIVKQLLTPTPLSDGTLEGKPGVNNFNSEQFMLDKETSVNIFNLSEGGQSMIPFDSDVKLPSVSKPQDLPTPKNDVFVDFEFDTTEDLFFMKMGGS